MHYNKFYSNNAYMSSYIQTMVYLAFWVMVCGFTGDSAEEITFDLRHKGKVIVVDEGRGASWSQQAFAGYKVAQCLQGTLGVSGTHGQY